MKKNLMPASHLKTFKAWLLNNGWTLEEIVSEKEVIRSRNKGKGIVILLKTADPNYYCLTEHHGKAVKKFIQTLHS